MCSRPDGDLVIKASDIDRLKQAIADWVWPDDDFQIIFRSACVVWAGRCHAFFFVMLTTSRQIPTTHTTHAQGWTTLAYDFRKWLKVVFFI